MSHDITTRCHMTSHGITQHYTNESNILLQTQWLSSADTFRPITTIHVYLHYGQSHDIELQYPGTTLKGNVAYTMALTADTLLANVTNWSRTLESHSKNRKPPGFAKYAASAPPPTPPRPESKEDDPRFGEDWEEGRKD